jgi:hypothetical protein
MTRYFPGKMSGHPGLDPGSRDYLEDPDLRQDDLITESK